MTPTRRLRLSDNVTLGQNPELEQYVILGEATGRQIASLQLVIGDNAIIRSGTVIYVGTRIGNDLRTGHNVVIREENSIGDDLQIWSNSVIDYGCRIGNHVKIHCNCYVAQFTIIEDDAFLAPGVIIANDMYPGPMFADAPLVGPTIKRGAQIGCNCTLRPGVVHRRVLPDRRRQRGDQRHPPAQPGLRQPGAGGQERGRGRQEPVNGYLQLWRYWQQGARELRPR